MSLRKSAALVSAAALSLLSLAAAQSPVKITETEDRLKIEIGGSPFTEYVFKGASRPYFYPVLGPSGAAMTRHWPIEENFPDEEHDHPHHKSLWFAHGDVNGIDFWSESPKAGRTVHTRFTKIQSGQEGLIQCQNDWVARDGTVVLSDDRTYRISEIPAGRVLDFAVTLHAKDSDIKLGDTKEGTMALRLAETMRLKGKVGKGHIVTSEGLTDFQTWGKRAKWVDYYGPVGSETVGVAIFDHPSNPRFPTWWHVREYGLFAANPFGLHDFEKKQPGAGDLTIAKGESATFRYRILFHRGDNTAVNLSNLFDEFSKTK